MSTAPTPALLPCPFCGSAKVTAKNEHTDLSGGYYIECSACLACTGLRYACGEDPRPLLAELWNRRAELEARKPLPLSDAEIIAAQQALALSRSRIGLPCTRCGTGKYRADCNAYHDFHRCDSCMHVPMWDADGNELGATAPLPGITGGSS